MTILEISYFFLGFSPLMLGLMILHFAPPIHPPVREDQKIR